MAFNNRIILRSVIVILMSCGNGNNERSEIATRPRSAEKRTEVYVKDSVKKEKSEIARARMQMNTDGSEATADRIQPDKVLKDAYKSYFPVGVAMMANQLKNAALKRLIAGQFSSVTPANEMKPKILQAREGDFNFAEADKIVSFALQNNMKIRGHTLVWPQMMPKWMYYQGKSIASKEVFLARLEKHITQTIRHYKGKVYCWDVVNEAIPYFGPDKMDSRKEMMLEISGEEYFEKAFIFARRADPNVRLFYNDNGLENKKKRDKIHRFLKKMKEKGVPIDGIGMQAHWGIEGISAEYLQETIDMFSSIGLEVQLTELDISIYPKRGNGRTLNARDLKGMNERFTSTIEEKQAKIYKTIFEVCRKNKGKITGITLWSAYDWPNYLTKTLSKKNYPYLFNEELKPKKAFFEVCDF